MNEREAEIRGLGPPRSETPKGIRTTEPRVVVTVAESDRESRKAKGKMALMTAAGVVLLATLITLGSTLHLAGKTGHEGIEHAASKGKEALFGKSYEHKPYEHYWETFGSPSMLDRAKLKIVGRHEALESLRETLGVQSGRPIGAGDRKRLEELLKLDHYSHSPGFWDHIKEKVADAEEDISKKVKSALGTDKVHHSGDTMKKLQEALGLEDESVIEKLKEILGGKEPTLWEKTKEKATKIIHGDGDKAAPHESIVDKVKDAVGLNTDARLLKEAKHRAEQTEDLITRVYEKRKIET